MKFSLSHLYWISKYTFISNSIKLVWCNYIASCDYLFRYILHSMPFPQGHCIFLNVPSRASLNLFSSFQTTISIFAADSICEKCPSRMRCWDLNQRPSYHESPPIAINLMPRAPAVGFEFFNLLVCYLHDFFQKSLWLCISLEWAFIIIGYWANSSATTILQHCVPYIMVFNGPTPASFLFIFSLFNKTLQFYNKSMWKMTI